MPLRNVSMRARPGIQILGGCTIAVLTYSTQQPLSCVAPVCQIAAVLNAVQTTRKSVGAIVISVRKNMDARRKTLRTLTTVLLARTRLKECRRSCLGHRSWPRKVTSTALGMLVAMRTGISRAVSLFDALNAAPMERLSTIRAAAIPTQIQGPVQLPQPPRNCRNRQML